MRFYSLILLLFSTMATAQILNDGWAIIGLESDGKRYLYHAESITKDTFPPTTITTKIAVYSADGKTNGYEQWDLKCREQEVRIANGAFINVSNDGISVRKALLHGLCGINQENGHWFLVGSLPNTSNTDTANSVLANFFFIDVRSIKNVSKPIKNGTSVLYHLGIFNDKKPELWEIVGTPSELVMDCNDRSNYYHQQGVDRQTYDKLKMEINSIPRAINHLVCNGYYFMNPADKTSPINSLDLSRVKKQCVELGFKQGTESFIKCAQTLSK